MPQFNKQKIAKVFCWWIIILPGIPFVFTSLGLLIYSYWPRDFSAITQFTVKQNIEYITLSAHGVNDSPTSWSNELQTLMTTTPYPQLTNVNQQHQSINWYNYASNVFICSIAGRKIGNEIGKRLAKKSLTVQPNLKAVHAIGHSCGAFVVLGICEGAKSVNPKLTIQTTYLDPVSVYSGIFWQYGVEHFGSCADFSDNYIDTRDTVPGSNQALPHTYTFDVTQKQTENDAKVPPHAWPTRYYLKAYKAQQVPLLYKADPTHIELFKKGHSTQLK